MIQIVFILSSGSLFACKRSKCTRRQSNDWKPVIAMWPCARAHTAEELLFPAWYESLQNTAIAMLSNSCYLISDGYNSLLANVINHISSPFMLSPYLMITAAVNLFFTELLIKFCLYIFVAGTPFSRRWKFRAYFIRLIQLFKREKQTVRRAKPCLAGLPGTRAVPRGGHSPARRSGLLGGCPQCPAILSLSSLC